MSHRSPHAYATIGALVIFILVAVAGFVAGFMNVLAGGGSFVTLPALIAFGVPALGANASSTVALFPVQVVTAFMARDSLSLPDNLGDVSIRGLAAISLVGGFFGGLLLLVTPPGVFLQIVPWLILFATGVFARGDRLGSAGAGLGLSRRGIYVVQGFVAVYGGYFGGGIGILMLAALTIFGFRDIKVMNGIKILLAMLMNVAAVGTFIVAGLVQWKPAIVLSIAALVGGLVGMAAARRVPGRFVRWFVIAVGLVLSAAFFAKAALG